MYFYRLIGNGGFGDVHYCSARNIRHAREICGLEPKCESNAVGHRISMREYNNAKSNYGVHIH